MPNFQRCFAVVLIVFVALLSVSVSSAAFRRKCPVRIPDSLLTLYLKSDLVVVGSIESEKTLKMTQDYDYGSYFDVENNLQISETLKGRDLNSTTFTESRFQPKPLGNSVETAEENQFEANVGDQALFFLAINDETGFYELADTVSGAKSLELAELNVYVKFIKELKSVVAAKKNQPDKLTEWLVRLVEEPITRDEGTLDLRESFNYLEYKDENEKETDDEKTFVLDENFRAENTSEIAESLTDSQKARLSNALFLSLNSQLAEIGNLKSGEEIALDYMLINLVNRWDKTFFPMASFTLLQNTGNANPLQTSHLLKVIAEFMDDESLYEISNDYASAVSKDDHAVTEYSDEEPLETPEIIESAVEETAATATEIESPNAAPESENAELKSFAASEIEEVPVSFERKGADKTNEPKTLQITYREYREKLLTKFGKRYGIAISQVSDAGNE